MQTFVFNENCTDKVVVYLHGAGYVRKPRRQHWMFVKKLVRSVNSAVYFAIYPKAPTFDYRESYKILPKLYKDLRKKYNKVIFMGDSSGGGLALGIAEYLINENEVPPDELILMSPWLDVSLDNPQISPLVKKDLIAYVPNERIWGKCWAGDCDVKDYRISPIYGSLKRLPKIIMFIGTREALYPDVIEFEKLLTENGVPHVVKIGENLHHVYPIHPIPEARSACKLIFDTINKL